MVSLSFSSFMIVMVLFIYLTINDTIAHTDDQAKQTFVVHEVEIDSARTPRSHLSVEKEVFDAVPAAAEFTSGKMGGRKMMIERKKNMKQVAEADSSGAASASIHSVGNLKCHKGEGKFRELSGISRKSHSMKANTGSFVAFNADYHMARPHPPKNN